MEGVIAGTVTSQLFRSMEDELDRIGIMKADEVFISLRRIITRLNGIAAMF